MAAISPSARADYSTNATSYFEAAIAGALASDSLWFKHNPGRAYRIRKASPSEVRLVQAVERRLLEPTEGCTAIVLIHRTDEGLRKRVVVEAHGLDLDTMSELEASALWADVVGSGRTSIMRGRG